LNPLHHLMAKHLWRVYFMLTFGIILFFYLVDLPHYQYVKVRLNATVLQHLENPLISSQMVWETYPVVRLLLGFFLVLILLLAFYSKKIFSSLHQEIPSHRALKRRVLENLLFFSLLAGAIYGKIDYYPLRWSDAYFSTNPFVSALGLNPVLYFANTLKNRKQSYDIKEVESNFPLMKSYLKLDSSHFVKDHPYLREVPPKASRNSPNIVIVILESFSHYKTGLGRNPLNPTPHFDELAKSSLYFNHYYVPCEGTARSVFATITGTPDVYPYKTSSRNPLLTAQNSLARYFSGYSKSYFIGGSASWGNIRGFLQQSIPSLRIYEESDWTSPRNDVWGISDLNLFKEAIGVLSKKEEPFFVVVQTAGGHRPYTIPEDSHEFEVRNLKKETVQKAGFINLAEFNSFRFMDHSIGLFMKWAKSQKFYDNTIFVFYGDHGIPGEAEHLSPKERILGLTRYHVPFILHAPKILGNPRVIEKIATEVDVLPTLLGLTGRPYKNATLGRDLFDTKFDDQRAALLVTAYRYPPELGLIDQTHYLMVKPTGESSLHELDSPHPETDLSKLSPKRFESMKALAHALYESSLYMLHHNKPLDSVQ